MLNTMFTWVPQNSTIDFFYKTFKIRFHPMGVSIRAFELPPPNPHFRAKTVFMIQQLSSRGQINVPLREYIYFQYYKMYNRSDDIIETPNICVINILREIPKT